MSSHYPLQIPRCEHIMDTGFRCGSPALKGKPFCYHHHDVHAARPKVGNKGYIFRPLETPKSVTLQLADIAQAAHDGAISLQLARTLFYYVQLGAPYVSRAGGYSGDVETEMTPAMEEIRTADHLTIATSNDIGRSEDIGSSEHLRIGTSEGNIGTLRESITDSESQIANSTTTDNVTTGTDDQMVRSSDAQMVGSLDGQIKKRPRYYDPEGCLAFLTREAK